MSVNNVATVHRSHLHDSWRYWVFAMTVGFTAGAFLVAIAEHSAADGSGLAHFLIFWVGYAFALGPVTAFIVSREVTKSRLLAAVAGLSVWDIVPKLMRTGHQILYFDEFDHFRMLQDLFVTGYPRSETGLLQIGATFPGLELFTSAVAHLSSLSLLNSALTVTVVVKFVTLIGVFALSKALTKSDRAGAIAALIYSLNPSWLYFDSQFSYEGMALAVFVWALVFVQRAISSPERFTQRANLLVAALLVCALVTIHHVTALAMAVVLVALAVTVTVRSHRRSSLFESKRAAWSAGALAAATVAWRLLQVGPLLYRYLAPSLQFSKAFDQLLSLIGLSSGVRARSVLSGGLPLFEILCAYAMIPILLVGFIVGVLHLIRVRRTQPSLVGVLALLGAAYFASLALVTDSEFGETVHRSWAFSFIGLAIVGGIAVTAYFDGDLRLEWRQWSWSPGTRRHRLGGLIGIVSLAVVTVGCVATATTIQYRFGGPVEAGTDAAAYGTQTSLIGNWFAHHASHGETIFADREAERAIAISTRDSIPYTNYLFSLTFDDKLDMTVLHRFQVAKITYIVVDRRMGIQASGTGYWYTDSEPHANTDYIVPNANVERYQCLLWLNSVYATTDYEVFQVNRSLLAHDLAIGSLGLSNSCTAVVSK